MTATNKIEAITLLEEKLKASLICYLAGDRENLGTRIAPDVIRVFYRHLQKCAPCEKVVLFLYTRGGDILTPFRLVSLIREYCRYFAVLIPFRAYSAGTLISLGADEIMMGKLGELSPIDPSVANAFNPLDSSHASARIPVSVEDVSAYISLAAEMVGLKQEESLTAAFLRLARVVHPLALGNVYRNYVLIRSLGRKMLEMHARRPSPQLVDEIIANLTEKLYAHNFMIPRSEAKNSIKLNVRELSPEVEETAWSLYESYETDLKLLEPFNPALLLQEHEQQLDFEAAGGIIESAARQDAFMFEGRVTRHLRQERDVPPLNVEIMRQGWKNTR